MRLGRSSSIFLAIAIAAAPAEARTLRTITIDGNLDDWSEVLLDRDQKVADRSQPQGDPDNPSQSQRDERGVAFTWDATNLYLYFSRTGSGTNSFSGVFYMDRGHDGLLGGTDRVMLFRFTGSSFNGFDLYAYADGGTPDALGGDGVSPVGSLGALITSAGANAAVDANGIGVECSVSWASLGVAAGTPMFLHPALSTNSNLPGGIQDNTNNLDMQLVSVLLSGGGTQGTAPGRFVDFPHAVTNDGTASDKIDLFFRTRLGFSVAIWSDPNGDGDPSDGAQLALDANGDGDMTDSGDVAPLPAADANGNGFVDGGSLAAGAVRRFVLRIGVPTREAPGSVDNISVFAASGYRPSVRVEVQDFVRAGLVTIAPPRSQVTAPGTTIDLAHDACNDSGAARVLDLDYAAQFPWSKVFYSDPNGDGSRADGSPLLDTDGDGLPDLGSVPDGTCVPFVLALTVPGGGPVGATNTVDVSVSDGTHVDTISDDVRVAASVVVVEPDRTARSQRGKTIFLRHDLRNAGAAADTFALTTSNTLGSAVSVLNDPNDDGDPDSSTVITSTGSVASGGRFPLLTRVRLPATVVHGQVETTNTIGTSSGTGLSDAATDNINIFGMLTYSDALFARPTVEFYGQCSTVYALAFRTTGGGTFRFAWIDPLGVTQRLGPDANPYSNGALDDYYDGGPSPTLGTWTIKLQERQGGSYVDVGPTGFITFEMKDLVSAGARIALNDTGADLYQLAGDPLVGYADVTNPTDIDVIASTIAHVAFRDANGDGVPTAGEDYVRPDGTIGAWGAGLTTSSQAGLDVYAGEIIGDRFVTPPVSYSASGVWTLRTEWLASCGFLIAWRNVTFTVGCQPPPTFGGALGALDVDPCAFSGIALAWDPATSWGLGGSGTYAVYRSTNLGFTPDASTLLDFGLAGTSYLDTSAAPDTPYAYVVRAENSANCSDGPNNFGLMDANFAHVEATDRDAGIVPVAAFDFTTPACLLPGGAVVSFGDGSSGPPQQWDWDFDGDGLTDATVANPTWTFTSAGDHVVALRVENPCGVGTISRVVTVGTPPVASIVASRVETCTDEPVSLAGSASSASAPASISSYEWDLDGDGVIDSNAADPGFASWATPGARNISLTVFDSLGCTDTMILPVQVNAELIAGLAAPVVDSCTGRVSVAAGGIGGRAPYSFAWDVLTDDGGGTGSATFPLGTTQIATVTVTDAGGCTAVLASAPIVVNPQIAVTLDPPVVDACTGDVTLVAHGSGGDGSYSFAFSSLTDDGTGRGTGTLPVGSNVETVTITDGAGCTASVMSSAIVVSSALRVTLDAPVVDPCTGDVTLVAHGAGGGGSYTFAFSSLTDDGTGRGTGTLPVGTNVETVTITDGAGCTASVASVAIVVNPPVQVTLDAPVIDRCTGDVTLTAHGAGGDGSYAFAFSSLTGDGTGGATGQLAPGLHRETITLTDGAGCVATTAVDLDIPVRVDGDFASTVAYIYPGQFRGDLLAAAPVGIGPFTLTWDVGSDGTSDGTGAALSLPMGANETVSVTLAITDGNGCTHLVAHDVVSGGCPSDEPIRLLMVRKEGAGLHLSWQPSTHPCHGRYDVLETAGTARPALSAAGTWPSDPAFMSLRAVDADGSDLDEQMTLTDPRAGVDRYFLVRDGGTDASWGPVESYGNLGVTP